MQGNLSDPMFDESLWHFDDAVPLIDSLRAQVNYQESQTREMVAKMGELQGKIERMVEFIEWASNVCTPLEAIHMKAQTLLKEIV